MPKEHLPVFQIQDFEPKAPKEPEFYLSSFGMHLRKHHFIQKPHKHDFFIVLFVLHGTGTHTIDFVSYPVAPGSVFFLSPGQVHSWNLTPDTDGYICFFSPEFYKLGFPDASLFSYPFFNPLLKPLVTLQAEETAVMRALFQDLEQEHKTAQWHHTQLIRNLLDVLLIRLARVYQTQHTGELPTTGHYTILQQLEALIETHFKEHQPVSFYAEKLHLTPKQLNESCRQSLGKTTSDLIQARVVLEARRLLVHSGLTISQIAAELGYFDNSYFTRFFKKKTGQTPEQFRSELT